jgi:methyltransferase (TIGR00027 family)
MKDGRASVTAKIVAAARALAPLLPDDARLVTDPYAARALTRVAAEALGALAASPTPLRALVQGALLPALPWTLYMQVRTRALDDALRAFGRDGGRQVVILGAGFDARAHRLGDALSDGAFFEVDHPATQAEKRARFGPAPSTRYLSWDFERAPMSALPARLAALGHDPRAPTFTLWEGVIMYLTPAAFDATLAAVATYSAPGSRLAFNYFERAMVERPDVLAAAANAAVRIVGEPFRLGFDPPTMREALAAQGFSVMHDQSFLELANALLPRRWSRLVRAGRRLAVVERTATARRER